MNNATAHLLLDAMRNLRNARNEAERSIRYGYAKGLALGLYAAGGLTNAGYDAFSSDAKEAYELGASVPVFLQRQAS
jgi:hypothetical protein